MCSSSLQKRHGMEPREIQNTAHNTVRHDRMARGIPEDRQGRILRFWERHNKTILPPSQWKSHHYGRTITLWRTALHRKYSSCNRAGCLCFQGQSRISMFSHAEYDLTWAMAWTFVLSKLYCMSFSCHKLDDVVKLLLQI